MYRLLEPSIPLHIAGPTTEVSRTLNDVRGVHKIIHSTVPLPIPELLHHDFVSEPKGHLSPPVVVLYDIALKGIHDLKFFVPHIIPVAGRAETVRGGVDVPCAGRINGAASANIPDEVARIFVVFKRTDLVSGLVAERNNRCTEHETDQYFIISSVNDKECLVALVLRRLDKLDILAEVEELHKGVPGSIVEHGRHCIP